MNNYLVESDSEVLRFEDREFETNSCKYWIENIDGLPALYYKPKIKYDYNYFRRLE